jgi:hypothetical protein
MHTRLVLTIAIAVLVLAFWAKTNLGTADHNSSPRYGGSFGPVRVLEPVY